MQPLSSDEEEGTQRGDLEEHEQRDDVRGEDHAQHRGGEETQQHVEPTVVVLLAEVAGAVGHDECAHTQGKDGEDEAETVQMQPQRDVQALDPHPFAGEGAALEDCRSTGEDQAQRCEEQDRHRIPGVAAQSRGEGAGHGHGHDHDAQRDEQRHQHVLPSNRRGVVLVAMPFSHSASGNL